jgi:long-chain fatty acid transport protein
LRIERIAGLVVIGLLIVAPGQARATVADTFGVGGKAVAMGGAFTAVADDHSATWYNPAGLTQPASIQATAGLFFVNYNLKVDGEPRPIDSTGGAYIGLVIPLFNDRGALGVWGYYPQNLLQLNQFTDPAEPSFSFEENSHQIFDLSPALAFDINPKWSIGAGVRLLSNSETTLDLFLPIAFNGGEVGGTGDILPVGTGRLRIEALNRISPNFGILWRPYENLKIGATYRYFTRQNIRINNNASTITTSSNTINFVNTLLSQDAIIKGRFVGVNFNSPHQMAVGIAYDPSPRLTLSADLVWENWSQVRDSRMEGSKFEDFQFILGANEPLLVNFRRFVRTQARDILIPRFGFEWRPKTKKGPLGPVDFQVRGGYAYRPSPFLDNQFGSQMVFSELLGDGARGSVVAIRNSGTNNVDADRHILSAGLGITIDDPVGWAEKWQFDFWWQQQILKRKLFTNQAFTGIPPTYGEFTQFGPKLRASGYISAAGAFFTAKF